MENGAPGLNTRNEKETVVGPAGGVRPGIRKESGKCSCVNLAEG